MYVCSRLQPFVWLQKAMALVSLAPAHDICLAVISLTIVIILRVARYPCPFSCEDLKSLWTVPLWELDSHHEVFAKCRRSSVDLWLAQVSYRGFDVARLLPRFVTQLKSHWNAVHGGFLRVPSVAATMLTLTRRFLVADSEHVISPEVFNQRLDSMSARLFASLVSDSCVFCFFYSRLCRMTRE